MTDIRTGGLAREALVAEIGVARLGGVAREALVSGGTVASNIRAAGMAREALLVSAAVVVPSGAQQYAVSIIS